MEDPSDRIPCQPHDELVEIETSQKEESLIYFVNTHLVQHDEDWETIFQIFLAMAALLRAPTISNPTLQSQWVDKRHPTLSDTNIALVLIYS